MADFRFKIQGSASPFLIQLSAGTTPVCETVFEYTGSTSSSFDPLKAYTCAVLSELEFNTSYEMRITDGVGNLYPTGGTISFITSSAPKFIENIKCVNLLSGGTDNSVDCFNVLTTPKYISIIPSLTVGESLNICLCIDSCNGATDSASVSVYKKLSGTGTYSLVGSVNNNDDCKFLTSMQYGDEICYDLNASVEHASGIQCNSIACACLDMINISYSGIDSISTGNTQIRVIESCCTTTTTIAPPVGTVSVLPNSLLFNDSGLQKLTVNVTAPIGQAWAIEESESWVTIQCPSTFTGIGNGFFGVIVDSNLGAPRFGTVCVTSTEPTAYVDVSQGAA